MRGPRNVGAMLALLAIILVVGIGPAWAPGSLSLQDVLAAVKDVPKLEAEITGELESSGLNAEKVVCWAARHGNHWKYLGGKRAAPYECEFGQRKLMIEAEITYCDAKGRSLGDADVANPRRAKTFREKNFRWAWSP